MKKLKLFLENFLIYGLSSVISKLIPLLMLPIVTRLMPGTEYFGISDLSNTLVQLCSALAVVGMYDAMYRIFFESDDLSFRKDVCSTTLTFTVGASFLVFILMILFRESIAQVFFGSKQYSYVVWISALATLVGATNQIVAAPTRMQNKRKVYLVTNAIGPLISYSIAIPLILKGYYVIALPLASLISHIVLEIAFGVMNRSWFAPGRFDAKLLKQMLVIAIPLIPNFLVYWIFNSSDKIMITNLIGADAAGVYSVGSKLGHASQLIYTAFAGGWQFFAFSTMKDQDQVKTNSKIFEYLGVISFATTAFVCAWSYPFYKVVFPGQYLSGFVIAPYLFLAPLLQMLFQVAANQFLVVKKTWPNMLILSIGAVLNVLLNLFLIPKIGIEGAAIATLIGYLISDVICAIVLCKMKLMVVSRRFIILAVTMVLYFVLWRRFFSCEAILGTVCAVILVGFYLFLYQKDLKNLYGAIKNAKK